MNDVTNTDSSHSQKSSLSGSAGRVSLPLSAKLVLVSISLVIGTVGLSTILTGYAPARSTRFGVAPALTGSDATSFGIVCLLLAVMPLLVLIRDRRTAAIVGGLLAVAIVAVIVVAAL